MDTYGHVRLLPMLRPRCASALRGDRPFLDSFSCGVAILCFLDFYVLHTSSIMDDILIVFCTLYVRRQREDLLASVFCAASDLSKNDNMLMSQKTARVRSSSSPSCVCMFEASDPSTLTGTIVVIGRQINTD